MHNFDLNHSDLWRVDLNLLVAFDALMQERHVSHAAARLNLGQPAMSHALARLRDTLGDPLFIRSGARMEPTARALDLAPRIRQLLEQANQFLLSEAAFDPARQQASFALSAPDAIEAMLYPPLIASLRKQTPGVQLRAYLLETEQQLSALDQGDVDLLIVAVRPALRAWHHYRPLARSGFVALYSREQVQLPAHPALADLAACDQVASSYRGMAAGVVDHLFEAHGLTRRIVAMTTSLLATGNILRQTPLISIQPKLYLPLFDTLPDVVHVPLQPDVQVELGMIWHRRHEGHPLHRYLRNEVWQHVEALFGHLPVTDTVVE